VLRRAQVFVRPSLSEGFGSAFLEAMASGVPVVASARGGITDFVSDGRTGLFCDPEEPRDIADKLIRLLTDARLRGHLRVNGLKLAREYDWDHIAEQMGDLYGEVAKK
jgi:glycosyltransferase involved in cell wall biosynthesis